MVYKKVNMKNTLCIIVRKSIERDIVEDKTLPHRIKSEVMSFIFYLYNSVRSFISKVLIFIK